MRKDLQHLFLCLANAPTHFCQLLPRNKLNKDTDSYKQHYQSLAKKVILIYMSATNILRVGALSLEGAKTFLFAAVQCILSFCSLSSKLSSQPAIGAHSQGYQEPTTCSAPD